MEQVYVDKALTPCVLAKDRQINQREWYLSSRADKEMFDETT